MKPYVYCFVLAGLFTAGCQKPPGTTAADAGAPNGGQTNAGGTVEIPAHTQFYLRFDKTLDSAKVKKGDLVTATLDQSIVEGGRDLLARGTKFGVRVTNAQLASAAGSVGLLTFNVETLRHGGAEYPMQATPVTVETSRLQSGVDPNAQIPHTPLTQKEGRVNAVLRPDQALLFESTAALNVKP